MEELVNNCESRANHTLVDIASFVQTLAESQPHSPIQRIECVCAALIRRHIPQVHAHLTKQQIEPCLFMIEWFLCLFTRSLTMRAVYRVLDRFLCDGLEVSTFSLFYTFHSLFIHFFILFIHFLIQSIRDISASQRNEIYALISKVRLYQRS